MKLTPGQEQVLKFIASFTAEHGYPPTLVEISGHLGATSSNAAHCHVAALVQRGAVLRTPKISRGLTITEDGHAHLEAVDFDHLVRRQLA